MGVLFSNIAHLNNYLYNININKCPIIIIMLNSD